MKKLLKSISLLILALLLFLFAYIYLSGPALPPDSDDIIAQAIAEDLPELVQGDSGYVVSDKHRIWYESIEPKGEKRGAILLFMGMASDALMWPPGFLHKLAEAGYQVIRFDYRGLGNSDWVEDWQEHPYTLANLAGDARVILDRLQVDKVHLLGMSMGGMVAQEFALNNPERTLTLTSMMSSGDVHDPELPGTSSSIVLNFTKIGIKYGLVPSEANTVKMMVAAKVLLRGSATYAINVQGTAQQVLYDLRRRKGFNPRVSAQHDKVVLLSASRYDRLKKMQIPTLIIHGRNDPLISTKHSAKLAQIIPHAKTLWVDNMGHDLPYALVDKISTAVLAFITGSSN